MNVIPATILDEFLENPNAIRDWGLSLEFNPEPNGRWPGKRSECLSKLNPFLFNHISRKVLSLFFDELPPAWNATMNFQIFPNIEGEGWIHQDLAQFTCILYLSHETDINCGSSLYKLKDNKYHPYTSPQNHQLNEQKFIHYTTQTLPNNILELKNQYESDTYEKVMDVKDKFNRLFAFSSISSHSANHYSPQNGEDRLTLVMFFENILHPKGFPVFRSKQTPMI
jgi:hypothetical protein